MLKKISLSICITIYLLKTGGQISVEGSIIDEQQNPLSWVHVQLLNNKDTAKIISIDITDLHGKFKLSDIPQGSYLLKTSIVGYKSHESDIGKLYKDTIFSPIVLRIAEVGLPDVEIRERKTQHYAEKIIYRVSVKEKESVPNAFNLMKYIPKLLVDHGNNRLQNVKKSGSVKILINGINADEIDLKTLNPNNVQRIEYFNIPPARFISDNTIASVINVITRDKINGWEGMINFSQAPLVEYGDYILSLKYNKNNAQWSFKHYYSNRNYYKRITKRLLTYEIEGVTYKKLEDGDENRFGYDLFHTDLKYTFQNDSVFDLSINFSPNYYTSNNHYTNNVSYFENLTEEKRINNLDAKREYFNPSLDIYFFKPLRNNREVTFNIVGTYLDIEDQYDRTEKVNNNPIWTDTVNITNNKYSLIVEGLYAKKLKTVLLTAGFKSSVFRDSKNIVSNLSPGKSKHNIFNNYGYITIAGKLKKGDYSISTGLEHISSKESENNTGYDFLLFRPSLKFNYPLGKNSFVSAYYYLTPNIPTIGLLSKTRYSNTEHLIVGGNPTLKPSKNHNIGIEYNFSYRKILTIYTGIDYSYTDDPIFPTYRYLSTEKLFLKTYDNQFYSKIGSLWADMNINPFKKEWLSIRMGGYLSNTKNHLYQIRKTDYVQKYIYSMLTLKYKKWFLQYFLKTTNKSLIGPFIASKQIRNELFLGYELNKIYLATRMYLGKSWKSQQKTIEGTLVNTSSSNYFMENKNMLVFTLSYNFSWGKKLYMKEEKLKNQDKNTGLFRNDK